MFISTWHRTRYQTSRAQSQAVYFYAAFAGILLLLASWTIVYSSRCLNFAIQIDSFIYSWASKYLSLEINNGITGHIDWIKALLLTFLLGTIGGYFFNFLGGLGATGKLFTKIAQRDYKSILINTITLRFIAYIYNHSSKRSLKKISKRNNLDLEIILLRSVDESIPTCFTLKNGKVYIGWIAGTVNPNTPKDMVRILPFISGYRENETHTLKLTTFYHDKYELLESQNRNPNYLEITFSFSEIISANLFDIELYLNFQDEPE